MTFNYTHSDTNVDSSVVWEAYYNDNTRQLAVVLANGFGYFYNDVDRSLFDRLTTGVSSAGRVYNREVKGSHTGGTLGYVGFENDEFVYVTPKTTAAPSWMRQRDSRGRFISGRDSVGMPKNLTYAEGAKVENKTDSGVTGSYLSLTPSKGTTGGSNFYVNANGVKRRHSVVFEVNGETKVYRTEAGSVDEAVNALTEATEALGLTVKVKEVVVSFE